MEKVIRRYKYLSLALALTALLFLFWCYLLLQGRPSERRTSEMPEKTIVNIAFTSDGELFFFDRQGNKFEPEVKTLPAPVQGDLRFITTLSLFGIKKNPFPIWVDTGDQVRCFMVNEVTGEIRTPCY